MRCSKEVVIVLLLSGFCPCITLPQDPEVLKRLEKEEMQFVHSSLKREIEEQGQKGGDSENSIRRAYRKMALRYRKNIFDDKQKFDFQMRILNLVRDGILKGESFGRGSEGTEEEEEEREPGSGRELPGGHRMSEDILKNIYSWQEFALEEGVRFDDPAGKYFAGHTQFEFREAMDGNWTEFVRTELAEAWPALSNLRLQAELSVPTSDGTSLRGNAAIVNDTVRQLTRDALTKVLRFLRGCDANSPVIEGHLPLDEDTDAWIDLYIKASQNTRSLLGSGSISPLRGKCAQMSDRDSRVALLELNLQSLEQLAGDFGEGRDRRNVAAEIVKAHAAVASVRAEPSSIFCRDIASHKRAVLDHFWEEYSFGQLISEAYPSDTCNLDGLASFVEFHSGANGELLFAKAEPDRSVLRAVRGLHALQRSLLRPAALDSGQWREAVQDIENAVWQGLAFPELHDAAGHLLAEIASAGLLPEVLEIALEHPPLKAEGKDTVKLRHGREPGDAQPARDRRFGALEVPGFSLKPIQRFEDRAIAMWGDEEQEENWDPVRLGLAYLDMTSACEMPLQVAACFLNAALWFWTALDLLGDRRGGDAWLEIYIFEDLYSVSPESKRLAMQFALKRAIFELVEYASQMADHNLLPGARLWVQRTAYLTLLKVTDRFGLVDDAQRLLDHLRRFLLSARLNPLWSPPITQVSDTVFVDILGQRLHASFLEGLYKASVLPRANDGDGDDNSQTLVVPSAVLEYSLYEATLLGGGEEDTNLTYARFEVMEALLQDSDRDWKDIESLLHPTPLPLDMVGFAAGVRPAWPAPQTSRHTGRDDEFVAIRGIRMNMQTGQASVLVTRASGTTLPNLARSDLVGILGLEDLDPLFLSLDPPSSPGKAKYFPHHPFQQAFIGLNGLDRRLELTLLHAALSVQQVIVGTEVGMRAPFPLQPCVNGLCRGLPPHVQGALKPVGYAPGEAWDSAPRLLLECRSVPYFQRFADGALEVLFGEPILELHPGKPLRELNEEAFRTWSVGKLRTALKQVEDPGKTGDDELPVLEKQELIDRLLRALDSGRFLEDAEEDGDPMTRFSRRFTFHMPGFIDRWPQLARLKPLCALRAANLILRNQLQQMNESAAAQREAMRASAGSHMQSMRDQQAASWRAAMSDIHSQVLRELGFVDMDPGQCWEDGQFRNFARCCSLGEFASQCFPGQNALAEKQRCCGAATRQTGFKMEIVAAVAAQLGSSSQRKPRPQDFMPVVQAWLQEPAGLADDGTPFSARVVDMLIDEISEETIMQNTEDSLQQPIERFAAEMKALQPLELGKLSQRGGQPDSWLPMPPIAASGNRRTIYTTVAFTPQLEQLDEDRIAAELSRPMGPVEVIPLEELGKFVRQAKTESSEEFRDSSRLAELDVMQQTSALLRIFDQRANDPGLRASLGHGGLSSLSSSGVEHVEDEASCSIDGWRELDLEKASTHLGFGNKLRIRRRMADDVSGEEGVVKNILYATEGPGEKTLLWEVDLGGPSRYLDFKDANTVISVPCNASTVSLSSRMEAAAVNSSESEDDDGAPKWPVCIEDNAAAPAASGLGLFVNLGAFGIAKGCFLDDCSHSDHFECANPADCARTCKRIGACQLWTFREASPSTCWLRMKSDELEDSLGAVSGNASCVPPAEEAMAFAKPMKPTLFQLVNGVAGTPPPRFWEEWDLVGVLEEFGHMSLDEVHSSRPSARQRSALRVASRATSQCALSWKGCS